MPHKRLDLDRDAGADKVFASQPGERIGAVGVSGGLGKQDQAVAEAAAAAI